MKIKKVGQSKFSEVIVKAIADGEKQVDLGACVFNQTALITVTKDEVDVSPQMKRENKDGKEIVVKVKRMDLISARVKALARLLPEGSYNAAQKDGILSWNKT